MMNSIYENKKCRFATLPRGCQLEFCWNGIGKGILKTHFFSLMRDIIFQSSWYKSGWISRQAPTSWLTEKKTCETDKVDPRPKEPEWECALFLMQCLVCVFWSGVMDFYWQRGAKSIESIVQALFKRNVPNFVKCLVRVWKGESAHIFHMQVKYRGGRGGNAR